MKAAAPLVAGVGGLPGATRAFSAVQAAWRFYRNERVELAELVEPLRDHVREQLVPSSARFVLVAHDWSKVGYPGHKLREDMGTLSNESDIGYELLTSLAIGVERGDPLAPVEMSLKTKSGILSTRVPAPLDLPHLDQIGPTMQASAQWALGKPIVHVIDREADSVGHYRQWDAAGHKMLIRGDDRYALWEGRETKLSAVRDEVLKQGAFREAGAALYHGRKARLEVAEAVVILDRPARSTLGQRRVDVPGPPLTMRLILTRIVDAQGQVLAQWFLLSNVPADWADAALLARCYYWRWRIESFFKLLKSHGFQVEHWLQETGPAIAKRLLVASMAATTVWQLQADDSAPAQELKTILIRMSGRQMKRKQPVTAPALLAGLWCLLAMLDTLELYDLPTLKNLITQVHLPISLIKTG